MDSASGCLRVGSGVCGSLCIRDPNMPCRPAAAPFGARRSPGGPPEGTQQKSPGMPWTLCHTLRMDHCLGLRGAQNESNAIAQCAAAHLSLDLHRTDGPFMCERGDRKRHIRLEKGGRPVPNQLGEDTVEHVRRRCPWPLSVHPVQRADRTSTGSTPGFGKVLADGTKRVIQLGQFDNGHNHRVCVIEEHRRKIVLNGLQDPHPLGRRDLPTDLALQAMEEHVGAVLLRATPATALASHRARPLTRTFPTSRTQVRPDTRKPCLHIARHESEFWRNPVQFCVIVSNARDRVAIAFGTGGVHGRFAFTAQDRLGLTYPIRDSHMALWEVASMAMPTDRKAHFGRWLILKPTRGDREGRSSGPQPPGLSLPRRVGSAILLGAWAGSGITVSLIVPVALSAHVPTAFAAELVGALLPRALLGGLGFATAAFLLVLRTGGPTRTLAAVSALSAGLARDVLVPRTEAALAAGQQAAFASLHTLSVAVFALSVLSAAIGCVVLLQGTPPHTRFSGLAQWLPRLR